MNKNEYYKENDHIIEAAEINEFSENLIVKKIKELKKMMKTFAHLND